MSSEKKALIAMSGGVDSSVAAFLTMSEGYECVGGTMHLYQPVQEIEDARAVARRLGMEFHIFDCQALFREQVLEKFVRCYEAGLTPNPCVDCNRHLKFGAFPQMAQTLGCGTIVTGHYASVTANNGRYLLKKAAVPQKDQSYFLATLTQEQLSRVRFPLGALTKEEVREIAAQQGFLTAKKKDSQDICFVPNGDYVTFLRQFTGREYACGDFLDLSGKTVGQHQGAVAYTLGQRKGLGLAMGTPVYVCGKDMKKNTVTVGPNEALYSTELIAGGWSWFPFPALTSPLRCLAKTRSRQLEQPATAYPEENGKVRVVFDEPQRAITPGQIVALYDGDTVIGGGTIE